MIDKALFQLPGLKKKMPLIAILAILQALVIVAQALFLSAGITRLWQGQGLAAAAPMIAGFLVSFLARELVNFFRQRFLDGFAYQMATDFRAQLLKKVFALGPGLASQMGSGSLATTAISGIDDVENYIKLVLSKVLNMMIVPVLILLAVFVLDWESGLVLLITFPFAILFMILLGYAAQGRAQKQYASYQILSNHFLDSLRGIATLKYFGRSKAYAQSIFHTSERFRKATMKTLQVAILSTFALDFFATLSVATVALFLGLRLMNGSTTLFPALMTLILAPEYFLPLREFAGDYHATLNGKNAFKAVSELLQTPSPVSSVLTEPVFWQNDSKLKLSAVTKTYDGQNGVKSVDFELTGFQKVASIGASGAGKSTLLNLLAGFLSPEAGQINLNQQSFETLNDAAWRQSLSFIPQSTYLFAGSLRENLAFYQSNSTDEAILQAAKQAGLGKLVEQLGLDCLIGAGGRTFSGGQMQRVALARAFLAQNQRNILLLDEPTAHLDIETELEIKDNILPLLEHKLVFLATHRLHWLAQMDLVIVMENGAVAGFGSPDELLANNAVYQKLLAQMRD